MEVTIANHCDTSFSFAESKKDKAKFNKNVKFSKNSAKEAMSISKEAIRITGRPNLKEKRSAPFKDTIMRHRTLKEFREKKYLFLDLEC